MAPDTLPPLPQEMWPVIDHLVTEDDTPVDNVYSEKQQKLLTEALYTSWAGPGDNRPFSALANVAVFASSKEPPIVPDVLLSLDVREADDLWAKENRSYLIWEFGKPPDLTLEIVSNLQGDELGEKKEKYLRMGVEYYVVWDPVNKLGKGKFLVFGRRPGGYARMRKPVFPELGLSLTVWHGVYSGCKKDWLRWCDSRGKPIPFGAEQTKRADKAEQRAQHAEQRVHEETERADKAERRAERLAAQLRSLGVEPKNGSQKTNGK